MTLLRSRLRPLTDDKLDIDRRAGALHGEIDRRSDTVRSERADERTHAGDLLVVDADDHVALPHAGIGRRPLLVDAHHHGADAIVKPDRLQADPEIAARNPPMGLEPGRDPLD